MRKALKKQHSVLQPPPAALYMTTLLMLVSSCRVSAGGDLPDVLKESNFIKTCQAQVLGRYQEQVVRAVIGHNLLSKGVLYLRMQLLLSKLLIVNASVVLGVVQEPIGFGTQEGHRLFPYVHFFKDVPTTLEKAAIIHKKDAVERIQIPVHEVGGSII